MLLTLALILSPLLFIAGIGLWLSITSKSVFSGLLESEKSFYDPVNKRKIPFDEPFSKNDNIYLSVVVPAYKEEKRLPKMMDETLPYLKERSKRDKQFTWEIIVVDDGSNDSTSDVVLSYSETEGCDRVRLLKLEKNVGKGGAVRKGMFVSRGKYRLMADADGATKFSDFEKLEESLKNIEKDGHGISIGSRSHLEENVIRERNFIRNILMWGFHFLVEVLGGVRGIRDTQCGFKLFTRETSCILFSNMHVERWCFDVELLYIARLFNFPVSEVPVNWTEIDGSKLEPLEASLQMFKDLLRIRLCYMFRIWKINKVKSD